MTAMQTYLSHLLGEISAESIVLVRDDAKMEDRQRRTFNAHNKKQRSTSPWKPLPKSEAPILPARTISIEDFASMQKEAQEQAVGSVYSYPPIDEDEDFLFLEDDEEQDYAEEEELDERPKDFESNFSEKESILDTAPPMRKRTSSLDNSFSRSSILMLDQLEPTCSSTTNMDTSLRTATNIMTAGQERMRRRFSDGLSLSHVQRLNLHGLIADFHADGSLTCNHKRCPPNETAPTKPFRKQSDDDLTHHPSKRNQEKLLDTLDHVILNSTWEPVNNKRDFHRGDHEEAWASLHDRQISASRTGLSV